MGELTYAQAFGQALHLARTSRRMRREELALASDLSYPYLCQIEQGIKEPSMQSVRKIATALGVRPSRLFILAEQAIDGVNVLGI